MNVPLETAVAPIGEVPVAEERRFSLTPGHLDEEARAQATRASITSATGSRTCWFVSMRFGWGALHSAVTAVQPGMRFAQIGTSYLRVTDKHRSRTGWLCGEY